MMKHGSKGRNNKNNGRRPRSRPLKVVIEDDDPGGLTSCQEVVLDQMAPLSDVSQVSECLVSTVAASDHPPVPPTSPSNQTHVTDIDAA
jgi:hypothetical protein